MKIFVTGAAGFIGAHLCDRLLERGHLVCGLDLFDADDPPGWQLARLASARDNSRFSFITGDVTDANGLRAYLGSFRPDALVHAAARKDLVWADREPSACQHLHTGGVAAVLQIARQLKVPQAVLCSSAHVYGGSRRFPFSEEDPADHPLSVLGAALRAAELHAYAVCLQAPVSVTVLRVFSVYGPRQSPQRFLPALCSAAERRDSMPIIGDDTVGRDMIHIDDVAEGIIKVIEQPSPFRVLNLGTGQTTTLAQVAEQVSWLAGAPFKRVRRPARPGELPNTYADMRLTREALGFSPAVPWEDGVRRYWEWFKDRPEPFSAQAIVSAI
jgi:UDP-glucuronate 4-epimerase